MKDTCTSDHAASPFPAVRLPRLRLRRSRHQGQIARTEPHRHVPLRTEVYDMVRNGAGNGHAPMPGAVTLVTALHGTRPLAVASNTPRQIVASYLQDAGILNAFDAIICSDQVSRPKPAPDAYLAACSALRRDPGDCLALEDSPTGAIAALTAGLYLIGIPSATDLLFPAHQHAATLNDHALWQSLGLTPSKLTA